MVALVALSACGFRLDAPSAPASSAPAVPAPAASASPVPTGGVAELDLSRGAPEVRTGGLFRNDRVNFVELSLALDELAASDVPTIFVRFGGARLGWGRSSELARGLAALRASKRRIVCHADDLGNSSYWVAAQGCDRVWLSPAGGLSTTGFSTELVFAKDLLDKLGVSADIMQVGKYKGTGETLTRAHASDEVKESIGGVLGDIRARFLEGVQIGRGRHDARVGLEDGPYSAEEALAAGYVDAVGYVDAALAEAGVAPPKKPEIVFGPGSRSSSGDGLIGLLRGLTGGKRKKASARHGVVAVLRAEGAISMEKSGGLTGSDGIDARTINSQLAKLERDDLVKAVVLRVDSPGGSALASDLIWHQIVALRKKKPVIVSVGDMAASGGYYMAVAGTKIVAEETSIVGSIGVVGGKVSLGPALAKQGVNVETVAAHGSDKRGGYLSALSPWDDATRARVQKTMEGVYDLFLARVAEGRGISKEVAATFAEGRVFSGREGRARGMVDDWGGLDRAISLAKTEAKLDPKAQVRVVLAPGGLLDLFGGGDDSFDEDAALGLARGEARLLHDLSPALATHAATLWPLVRGERSLVAVPFALLVP